MEKEIIATFVKKKMKETIAVWFSCGAASAVAAKKILENYGETHNVIIVNNPVVNEHKDNLRFLKDCEKWFGQEIVSATNPEFPSCDIVDVFEKRKYISGTRGAPCTSLLKKEARYHFERTHNIHWHVLGFTVEEKDRNDRFMKFERDNVIPILINLNLTKEDCFSIVLDAGIELPEIYGLGYPNANCIGCVKSQAPKYWNLVRRTFPEIFKQRAEQSRRIGCKLIRIHAKYLPWTEQIDGLWYDRRNSKKLSTITKDGKKNHSVRIYLDELPEEANSGKIKSWECGIFCDTK